MQNKKKKTLHKRDNVTALLGSAHFSGPEEYGHFLKLSIYPVSCFIHTDSSIHHMTRDFTNARLNKQVYKFQWSLPTKAVRKVRIKNKKKQKHIKKKQISAQGILTGESGDDENFANEIHRNGRG